MKTIKKLMYYFKLGQPKKYISEIFIISISLITLILISIVVYRAINLRNKVDTIENSIKEKLETTVKIDYPDYTITSKEGAAFLAECLKAPLTSEEQTESLKKKK